MYNEELQSGIDTIRHSNLLDRYRWFYLKDKYKGQYILCFKRYYYDFLTTYESIEVICIFPNKDVILEYNPFIKIKENVLHHSYDYRYTFNIDIVYESHEYNYTDERQRLLVKLNEDDRIIKKLYKHNFCSSLEEIKVGIITDKYVNCDTRFLCTEDDNKYLQFIKCNAYDDNFRIRLILGQYNKERIVRIKKNIS